jgi:hypothetical protein
MLLTCLQDEGICSHASARSLGDELKVERLIPHTPP